MIGQPHEPRALLPYMVCACDMHIILEAATKYFAQPPMNTSNFTVMGKSKRKFCHHCHGYVDGRTYRLHHSLYFDKRKERWHHTGKQALSSDEESCDHVVEDVDTGGQGEDFSDTESNDTRAENIRGR